MSAEHTRSYLELSEEDRMRVDIEHQIFMKQYHKNKLADQNFERTGLFIGIDATREPPCPDPPGILCANPHCKTIIRTPFDSAIVVTKNEKTLVCIPCKRKHGDKTLEDYK